MRKIVCDICQKTIKTNGLGNELITISSRGYKNAEICSADCGIIFFQRHKVAIACAEERFKKDEEEKKE